MHYMCSNCEGSFEGNFLSRNIKYILGVFKINWSVMNEQTSRTSYLPIASKPYKKKKKKKKRSTKAVSPPSTREYGNESRKANLVGISKKTRTAHSLFLLFS